MLKEFKAFVMKGNLIEIAVGLIMALAFAAVVSAFTDVVLGFVSAIFGGDVSFNSLSLTLNGATIPYGAFLTALVNFLIVAWVLFMVIKAYNRMRGEQAAGPTELELLTQIRDELRSRNA